MYSTAVRPSIRRLMDDHGTEWHSSEYKCCRKKWYLKKRIITAIEAIQSIKQMSRGCKFLEKKPGKSVNLSAQSLPTLSDEVDISGKCRSSSGKWRPLCPGDHLYDDIYSVYLDALGNKLGLRTNMM